MQEGFASEVKPDWLVRLYFMSFIFTTLVIFEVVLCFVVDGFELIVHPCDEHGELYCHRKLMCTLQNYCLYCVYYTGCTDRGRIKVNSSKLTLTTWMMLKLV